MHHQQYTLGSSLPHHRLLAYKKALELLAAVRAAQIRIRASAQSRRLVPQVPYARHRLGQGSDHSCGQPARARGVFDRFCVPRYHFP